MVEIAAGHTVDATSAAAQAERACQAGHIDRPVIGFTAGVFDLFHAGHEALLMRASERCDFLRVGVISDEISAVMKRKTPVIPLEQRMSAIRAMSCVDEAVPIVEERLLSKVEAFYEWGFDIAFSGDDHADDPSWQDEERLVASLGARIEYLPYTQGISSTMLREALEADAGNSRGSSRTSDCGTEA